MAQRICGQLDLEEVILVEFRSSDSLHPSLGVVECSKKKNKADHFLLAFVNEKRKRAWKTTPCFGDENNSQTLKHSHLGVL